MTTSDVHEPDELRSGAGDAPRVSIRNLDRGQVVEVTVVGRVDEEAAVDLGRRLHTLATRRQPMTLYLDLADATLVASPPASIDAGTAAAALDGFGGRLVVRDADDALRQAIAGEPLSRSLSFERTAGPSAA